MKIKLFLTAALIGTATLSAQAGIRFGFSFDLPLPVPVVVTAPVVPVAMPCKPFSLRVTLVCFLAHIMCE